MKKTKLKNINYYFMKRIKKNNNCNETYYKASYLDITLDILLAISLGCFTYNIMMALQM